MTPYGLAAVTKVTASTSATLNSGKNVSARGEADVEDCIFRKGQVVSVPE